MSQVERHCLSNQDETQHPSETFQKSYPHYNSKASCEAVKKEINGLLDRGSFTFVQTNQIPNNANEPGGSFTHAIKQPETPTGCCKARFVGQ